MAKIVHATSVHDPFDTRIFMKQCQSLLRAGHEVVVVAVHPRDEVVDGVRIRAVSAPQNRRERFLTTTRAVVRAALEESPDLVQLHDPELLPFAGSLRRGGAVVVFDMHENVPEALRTKEWIPAPARPLVAALYRTFERRLLTNMPVILAERSYETDYRWVETAVTVLNLPVSDKLVRIHEEKHATPTVGYMGIVNRDRGVLTTGRALGLLRDEGVLVNFECVGRITDATAADLHHLAGGGVNVHGPLPALAGWRLMAACHAGLALLRPVPNYLESYPTKLFEYMALGVPVICSDFPLYREVVEGAQCGLCVDPEDPHAIADAIRWVIEHPEEARQMGLRGRAAVLDRYDWKGQAERLLAFYAQVLSPTGHSVAS